MGSVKSRISSVGGSLDETFYGGLNMCVRWMMADSPK